MQLPVTENTPLVRICFTSDAAWEEICAAVQTPNADGFRAYVTMIEDRFFADADPTALRTIDANGNGFPLLILADAAAMASPDFPLLCVYQPDQAQVRVLASELWGIENNIAIGNMDFAEFVRAADAGGIFRGFD